MERAVELPLVRNMLCPIQMHPNIQADGAAYTILQLAPY